jgi:hypothetical protein
LANQHSTSSSAGELLVLGDRGQGIYFASLVAGIVGLIATVLLGILASDGFKHFLYSYLAAYLLGLSIALGGLFFVLIQHLTKAGWSVSVRRVAEWYGATLPVFGILFIPVLVSVAMGNGHLYPWAASAWHAEHGGFKALWLNQWFFIIRAVAYFVIWSSIAVWYWKKSVQQDEQGGIELTVAMQRFAPVATIIFGLTITLAAWDWIMALDPEWYSTIFGVYFFAGCALGIFASIILSLIVLQHKGLLRKSVTPEHFHDLGKFLFAFTFFWGYIGFAQFMLQWYGNLSDETEWFVRHGGSTAHPNEWSKFAIALLFGHLLIPFPGLLSRHVKRNTKSLGFWAVWVLVFCWVDIFWMVMPQYEDGVFHFGLIDIAAVVGVGGILIAAVLWRAAGHAVRPMKDPRLADSVALQNF